MPGIEIENSLTSIELKIITGEEEVIQLEVNEHLPVSSSDTFIRIAGEDTSALRVVWEDSHGVIRTLDSLDIAHANMLAGLTVTAADANTEIVVQREGIVDVAGLGLVPGRVWAGADGRLTQVPPADGLDIFVGMAVASERLYLSFNEIVYLED